VQNTLVWLCHGVMADNGSGYKGLR